MRIAVNDHKKISWSEGNQDEQWNCKPQRPQWQDRKKKTANIRAVSLKINSLNALAVKKYFLSSFSSGDTFTFCLFPFNSQNVSYYLFKFVFPFFWVTSNIKNERITVCCTSVGSSVLPAHLYSELYISCIPTQPDI